MRKILAPSDCPPSRRLSRRLALLATASLPATRDHSSRPPATSTLRPDNGVAAHRTPDPTAGPNTGSAPRPNLRGTYRRHVNPPAEPAHPPRTPAPLRGTQSSAWSSYAQAPRGPARREPSGNKAVRRNDAACRAPDFVLGDQGPTGNWSAFEYTKPRLSCGLRYQPWALTTMPAKRGLPIADAWVAM